MSAFALTNYAKGQLIGHMWRTATWAKPTQWWWSLWNNVPNEIAGSGAEVTTAGTAYTRIQRNPGDANYSALALAGDTSAYTTNVAALIFPNPLGIDWGVMSAVGVHDANVAGNLWAWTLVPVPFYVRAGDIGPTIPAGAFNFDIP